MRAGPTWRLVGAGVHFDGTGSSTPTAQSSITSDVRRRGGPARPNPVHAYAAASDYTVSCASKTTPAEMHAVPPPSHVIASSSPPPGDRRQSRDPRFRRLQRSGDAGGRTLDVFTTVADPSSVLHLTSAIVNGPTHLIAGPNLPIDLRGTAPRHFTVRFTPPPESSDRELELTATNALNSPLDVSCAGERMRCRICDAGGPYAARRARGSSSTGAAHRIRGITLAYTGSSVTATLDPAIRFTATAPWDLQCRPLADRQLPPPGVSVECTTSAAIFANPICDAGGPYVGSGTTGNSSTAPGRTIPTASS